MPDSHSPPTDFARLAHALFEESGDALILVDPQSDAILEANPILAKLSGYTRDELRKLTVSYLFRAEAAGGSSQLRRASQHTDLHLHGLDGYFLRTKAGGWVPVSLTVSRLHVEPKALGLITARDRTEQRTLLETVRASQEQLGRVLEAVADGIAFVDAGGVVRLVNAAALRILGVARGDLVGKTLAEVAHVIAHPDGRPLGEGERIDQRVLGRGETLTAVKRVVARPDGTRALIRGNAVPMRDERGNVAGMVCSFTDVTEQTRVEDDLAREHAMLRGLIDSLPDPIYLKDRAGNYLGCNAAFEALVGQRERALVGHSVPAPGSADAERAVRESGTPKATEKNIHYPDGREALFDIRHTPLVAPGGAIGGVVGVYRDVTQPRLLEDRMRQAGKLEAVGRLAGGVAHDFNNLLTAVLGNLTLAQETLPADHAAREMLAETEKAAWRATELTRQLLGFARRSPLRTEPTDLNAAVTETVSLLRRTIDPRITIRVHASDRLGTVKADPGRLGQVLMNLCLNARDAMPGGGTLTLETTVVAVDDSHALRQVDARVGKYVRLRVTDTGMGIAPENLGRVFEPFFTTKEPGRGTGLGLATVYGIVRQHDGWVECASEMGRGTTFDVYLPRGGSATASPASAAPTPVAAPAGTTVLFADDEASVRGVAQQVLERHGYTVLMAADGQEAVELYERERDRVAIVVLDLTMPRLSGADALKKLVAVNPSVKVLLSSGYAAEQAPGAGEPGVCGFLGKPYRPSDLAAAVRTALEKT